MPLLIISDKVCLAKHAVDVVIQSTESGATALKFEYTKFATDQNNRSQSNSMYKATSDTQIVLSGDILLVTSPEATSVSVQATKVYVSYRYEEQTGRGGSAPYYFFEVQRDRSNITATEIPQWP